MGNGAKSLVKDAKDLCRYGSVRVVRCELGKETVDSNLRTSRPPREMKREREVKRGLVMRP